VEIKASPSERHAEQRYAYGRLVITKISLTSLLDIQGCAQPAEPLAASYKPAFTFTLTFTYNYTQKSHVANTHAHWRADWALYIEALRCRASLITSVSPAILELPVGKPLVQFPCSTSVFAPLCSSPFLHLRLHLSKLLSRRAPTLSVLTITITYFRSPRPSNMERKHSNVDPGLHPYPQTGTSASQEYHTEAQQLLGKIRRIKSDRDEETVRFTSTAIGQLPEKVFETLEQFQDSVFHVLIERLKLQGLDLPRQKLRQFRWCLPMS
jgi:hypothetical protein